MIEVNQALLGAGRALAAAGISRGVRRALHRRALRHLRLHRVVQHHRRLPEHGAPDVRSGEGADDPRVRGHRHLPLRRRDQRHAGRARTGATRSRPRRSRRIAPPCTPRGSSLTATSAIRSRAASTRAGICTRRSCRCATRPASRSFAKGFGAGGGAPAQLRREGGAGDAGRRGLRRRGHRPGPAQLFPARAQLRRDRSRRDRAHRASRATRSSCARSRRSSPRGERVSAPARLPR